MKTIRVLAAVAFVSVALASGPAWADADTDLIKSAEAAAPASVSASAAVYAVGADGKMKTLRESKTGWWCMPDDPTTPGSDPMCGDANAMEWAMAWMNKTEPPKGKIGFIYMLMGGPAASNLDPFAIAPAAGSNWIVDRPHVMIVNFGDMMTGYPTKQANPDTSQPYVMWGGTPYAHLMLPVQ